MVIFHSYVSLPEGIHQPGVIINVPMKWSGYEVAQVSSSRLEINPGKTMQGSVTSWTFDVETYEALQKWGILKSQNRPWFQKGFTTKSWSSMTTGWFEGTPMTFRKSPYLFHHWSSRMNPSENSEELSEQFSIAPNPNSNVRWCQVHLRI